MRHELKFDGSSLHCEDPCKTRDKAVTNPYELKARDPRQHPLTGLQVLPHAILGVSRRRVDQGATEEARLGHYLLPPFGGHNNFIVINESWRSWRASDQTSTLRCVQVPLDMGRASHRQMSSWCFRSHSKAADVAAVAASCLSMDSQPLWVIGTWHPIAIASFWPLTLLLRHQY